LAGIVLKTGGTENNTGTIAGNAYGVEIYGGTGTVLNGGYITAASSAGYGALLKNGGSITNEVGGYIGGNTAVSFLDGGSVTNASGAVIESNFQTANAVAVNFSGGAGTLSNAGVILANSSVSTFAAVFLGAGGSVTNSVTGEIRTGGLASAISIRGGAGDVVNDGTILAGVYAVSLAANGVLTNTGGIYGRVTISGNGGTVTNSGSIYAAGVPLGKGSGIGVSVGPGATVANQAGGYIGGGGPKGYGITVYGGGAIVNAGTITGAKAAIVFSGFGANTLTLQSGSALRGAVIGSTAQGANNALVLTGSGITNNAFVNFNTLSMQGSGTWRLGGVSSIGATTVSTGTLAVTGNLTTAVNEVATITIGRGDKLMLNGASTLSGITAGLGTLQVLAGRTTIAANAEFTVSHWSVLGASARVTIGETLIYQGVFTAGTGAVVTVSSGPLVLRGTAVFANATITGTKRVRDWATTTVAGLTLGDAGGFANKAVLTESGAVVLAGAGELVNSAGASWNIINDSGIALGASSSSPIVNSGLFEKTGGTGVSLIAPTFFNSGHVSVSSGALDFHGAVSGSGVDTISGSATLEFDASVASGQTIAFQGGGGVLDLGSPTSFSGAISGFDTTGANDAVELLGSWTISGFTQQNASQGELTLSSGARTATLAFEGNYNPALFAVAASAGHSTITYA
jgi:hypothetical protein